MSTTPQTTLNTLINTLQSQNQTLWRILVTISKNAETLTNNFNQVVAGLNWEMKMELSVATGTDKLPTWQRVTMPRDISTQKPTFSSITLNFVVLSFKPVLTGTFTGDILYSRDGLGATWGTIFKPSPLNMTSPTGNQVASWSDLAVSTLYDGDLLRIDCSGAGGATGLEVTLLGSYNS